MIKAIFSTIAVASVCICAQTHVFSFERGNDCVSTASANDVEKMSQFENGFLGIHQGCVAKVVSLNDKSELFSIDVAKIGMDTTNSAGNKIYVHFYRNMMSKDGSWSALVAKPNGDVMIVHGGKTAKLATEKYMTHELRTDGNNVYLVVTGYNSVDVYILRNDLHLSALNSRPAIYEAHADPSFLLWRDINPAGQRMDSHNTPRNLEFLRK